MTTPPSGAADHAMHGDETTGGGTRDWEETCEENYVRKRKKTKPHKFTKLDVT